MKSLMLLVVALALAACSERPEDVKYQGKTAQEWAAAAERNKAAVVAPTSSSSQAEAKATEKAAQERQNEANKKYLALADARAADLVGSPSATWFVEVVVSTLRSLEVNETPGEEELVLGGADNSFSYRVMSAIVPEKATDGTSVFHGTAQQARGIIRDAVIRWASKEHLDSIWGTMRPVLRQQYALLKTLRRHETLFRTTYTAKTFEMLSECLVWHEAVLYPASDKKIVPTEQDTRRCTDVFKKFGIRAEFGGERGETSARNALWIVRFLARREADGGEKFAQQFQKFALDYIKS